MILLDNPKKLKLDYIKKINPKLIFFPDWSWIIPNEIVQKYQCVCFHESNLPKFRGGSPIQNQIIRGIKKTKTTHPYKHSQYSTLSHYQTLVKTQPHATHLCLAMQKNTQTMRGGRCLHVSPGGGVLGADTLPP